MRVLDTKGEKVKIAVFPLPQAGEGWWLGYFDALWVSRSDMNHCSENSGYDPLSKGRRVSKNRKLCATRSGFAQNNTSNIYLYSFTG